MIAINGNEKVLVCPLGWGLGHATRVIPVIEYLQQKGCKVFVGADQNIIDFLKPRFPNAEFTLFPSLKVRLSKSRVQVLALLRIAIKLLLLTKRERKQVKQIISKFGIDLLISDNRYGLYNSAKTTVLITHQLWVQFPWPFKWAEPIGRWYIKRYAERYTQCWVPDNPNGFKLSGNLSQPKTVPKNSLCIGLLSRFHKMDIPALPNSWDAVAIISGPPPQRELFEQNLVNLSNSTKIRMLIIQGLPYGKHKGRVVGKATLVPHLPDKEFIKVVKSAKMIICRSGYSTIMDLVSLNRSALLVPTPGQTEQEYLAKHLAEEGLFSSCRQSEMKNITVQKLEYLPKNLKDVNFHFFSP